MIRITLEAMNNQVAFGLTVTKSINVAETIELNNFIAEIITIMRNYENGKFEVQQPPKLKEVAK